MSADRRTKPAQGALVAVSLLALLALESEASAAEPRRKVVVAGPSGDPITARVQQELGALGFETVRVGNLDGCARSAVVVAATDEGALAATCSDGEQVGIWVSDGSTLRLRDVVVARDDNARSRETTAVRAAEITRASLALRDAPDDGSGSPRPPPPPPPSRNGDDWTSLDRPTEPPKPKASPPKIPRFAASAGIGVLMGIDASAATFSGQVLVGLPRHLAIAGRLEYPLEAHPVERSQSQIRIAPALAALGVELPLLSTASFIIPRIGGGLAVAWIRARSPGIQSFDESGNLVPTRGPGEDSVVSPGAYGSGGVSLRIVGPVRIAADALFGATLSRFVTREQGRAIAFWGQPFGAVALRVEAMF